MLMEMTFSGGKIDILMETTIFKAHWTQCRLYHVVAKDNHAALQRQIFQMGVTVLTPRFWVVIPGKAQEAKFGKAAIVAESIFSTPVEVSPPSMLIV